MNIGIDWIQEIHLGLFAYRKNPTKLNSYRSVFLRIRRANRKTKKDLKRTEADIHTSTY